jgi:hypothetical protein
MVHLKILTGKMAGTVSVARHFPVRVGRMANSDLRLEEPGVWDQHFQIVLDETGRFVLVLHPNALATINGQPPSSALRNGDHIEIGSLKIQFWLGEASQRGLKIREAFVWSLIAAVSFGQIAIVYWLIR